jgi:hypothetical protein
LADWAVTIFRRVQKFVALMRTRLPSWKPLSTNEPHPPYRRCPRCGERGLRMSDRQRVSPDVYRSRVFLLKSLCLACGYRETERFEQPHNRQSSHRYWMNG